MPNAPLLASLGERFLAIDAAINEYHAEIDRNPFNADLRRHPGRSVISGSKPRLRSQSRRA